MNAPQQGHLLFRGAMRVCSQKRTGITNNGAIAPGIHLFDASPSWITGTRERGGNPSSPQKFDLSPQVNVFEGFLLFEFSRLFSATRTAFLINLITSH
jgi:hypothetical protein